MDGELSFFELGVGDPDRAREFYATLFGWEFVDEGGGATIETPNFPGGLHGNDAGASPYVFFRVGDLDAARARVRELGGEVGDDLDDDPDTVARFGRFAICKDDQGSGFGLHPAAALGSSKDGGRGADTAAGGAPLLRARPLGAGVRRA